MTSPTVIERCGGVLENVLPHPGSAPKRRYWIPLDGPATGP